MSDITFKITAATHVGLVRTNNEDNFIVNPDLTKDVWEMESSPDYVFSLGEYGCLLVVADGMGGMNAGEVASELAVTSVRRLYSEVSDYSSIIDSSSHIEAFMKKVIVTADADIKERVKTDPSTSGMGTTIVMAWVIGNMVHVAWCGDSRAYLFNRQSGLSRLTRDHSYVQELVDAGKLDPELAFDHPNSNIITRSLGDSSVKAQPDYVCQRLSAGDYVLLCSDGLCGLCRDEEILDILMQDKPTLEEYEHDLFAAALDADGHDNITIALFECLAKKEKEVNSTLTPEAMSKTRKIKKDQKTEAGTEKKSAGGLLWVLIGFLLALALAGAAWYFKLIPLPAPQKISVDASVEQPAPQQEEEAPAELVVTDEVACE